jgi:hypothetical protein
MLLAVSGVLRFDHLAADAHGGKQLSLDVAPDCPLHRSALKSDRAAQLHRATVGHDRLQIQSLSRSVCESKQSYSAASSIASDRAPKRFASLHALQVKLQV